MSCKQPDDVSCIRFAYQITCRGTSPCRAYAAVKVRLGARALGAGCCGSGSKAKSGSGCLPRKEVIQPHLPVRLPCYDFTPLTPRTFDASAPRGGVRPAASGADDSGGVTGGVYKARERIHRGVLIRDY